VTHASSSTLSPPAADAFAQQLLDSAEVRRLLAAVAAHVPLALLMRHFHNVGLAHSLGVLAIGLACAVSGRAAAVVYTCAYIMGTEVLWRMTNAAVVWEFGKYAMMLIMVVLLIRRGRALPPASVAICLLLMVPAVVVTFMEMPLYRAREAISFNISGPVGLLICIWVFNNLTISRQQLVRLALIFIGPTVGILTLALHSTLTATEIVFTTESNFVLSGGFGPNQVSPILALGAVFCAMVALLARGQGRLRVLMILLGTALLSHSIATFSRSGLFTAGGAIGAAGWYLIQDRRVRTQAVATGIVVVGVIAFLIWPWLDQQTHGKITARYTEMSHRNRSNLVREELQMFQGSPLLGVGVGRSKYMRAGRKDAAAHTEFTRVVAEHGSVGIIGLLIVSVMLWRRFHRIERRIPKAMAAAFIMWPALFMLVNAMRLTAPGFLIGLSIATLVIDDDWSD
jgi:hypothetical protein